MVWFFDGKEHVRIATLPGMWDRTVTVGSAGSTFVPAYISETLIQAVLISRGIRRPPAGVWAGLSDRNPSSAPTLAATDSHRILHQLTPPGSRKPLGSKLAPKTQLLSDPKG